MIQSIDYIRFQCCGAVVAITEAIAKQLKTAANRLRRIRDNLWSS